MVSNISFHLEQTIEQPLLCEHFVFLHVWLCSVVCVLRVMASLYCACVVPIMHWSYVQARKLQLVICIVYVCCAKQGDMFVLLIIEAVFKLSMMYEQCTHFNPVY
jgi:hypothetical protein